MYLCICVCVSTYVCMCVCMYVRMYTCICVCVYVCMYVCMYVCVYICVCMYVYVYLYVHVCMYICYVCVYIYIYIYMYACIPNNIINICAICSKNQAVNICCMTTSTKMVWMWEKVVPLQAIKHTEEAEVKFHSFLPLALAILPQDKIPGIHLIRGWLGPGWSGWFGEEKKFIHNTAEIHNWDSYTWQSTVKPIRS